MTNTGDTGNSDPHGELDDAQLSAALNSGLFTEDEYNQYFGSPEEQEPLAPRSQRLPKQARWLGIFLAMATGSVGFFGLFSAIITNPDIRDPAAIEAAAWDRVAESEFGWLVADIVVSPIDAPQVGAFVTNNPPDGIITIDLRPWDEARLDELMDHEIGHLLDFAVWEPFDDGRTGGLGTEAWAECAAVDAGTRRVDNRDPGGEYHCFGEEIETFRSVVASVTEVCARWGNQECRSLQ